MNKLFLLVVQGYSFFMTSKALEKRKNAYFSAVFPFIGNTVLPFYKYRCFITFVSIVTEYCYIYNYDITGELAGIVVAKETSSIQKVCFFKEWK